MKGSSGAVHERRHADQEPERHGEKDRERVAQADAGERVRELDADAAVVAAAVVERIGEVLPRVSPICAGVGSPSVFFAPCPSASRIRRSPRTPAVPWAAWRDARREQDGEEHERQAACAPEIARAHAQAAFLIAKLAEVGVELGRIELLAHDLEPRVAPRGAFISSSAMCFSRRQREYLLGDLL